jgi:hypothetical protein
VRTSRLNLSKMVFGPNARRRPETLRIVARLAMEAILPLPGKSSGRVSPPCDRRRVSVGHGRLAVCLTPTP